MPRSFPSAYGQTAGGSRSSRKRDLSGSTDAAVETLRTIEPLPGGKTYFNPPLPSTRIRKDAEESLLGFWLPSSTFAGTISVRTFPK